jgi:hypothetical protein
MKTKIRAKGFWPQHPLIGVTFAYAGRRPPQPNIPAMLDHGVYIISGNHRRAALVALCNDYPNNKNYRKAPVLVLTCDAKEEVFSELKLLGSASNDIDHFSNAVTFPDKMFILRREYDTIRTTIPKESDQRKRLRKVKDAYGRIWDIADNTMGTHMSMIGRSDEQWLYLARYLHGEHLKFLPKSRKRNPDGTAKESVVRSWAGLHQTGNLNDDNFAKLMNELFSGKTRTTAITNRVRRMLADQFVRSEMMGYFSKSSWSALVEAEPLMTSPTSIEKYVNLIMPSSGTKFNITKEVRQEWEDIKSRIKRDRAHALVSCVLLYVVVCCCMLFSFFYRLLRITNPSRCPFPGEQPSLSWSKITSVFVNSWLQ